MKGDTPQQTEELKYTTEEKEELIQVSYHQPGDRDIMSSHIE